MKQSGSLNKRQDFEPIILLDNVILYHDGAYMYCDSAYLDEATNSFEAFGKVKVEQGDTLFLYSQHMHYDGNTKILVAKKNVRLENRNTTLFTDELKYERDYNIAYYYDGGMLVDEENELTSNVGQYEPKTRIATFIDNVKLINPKFTLYAENLKYNTETKVATIEGQSRIEADSATIYSTRGWYNTTTEESLLLDRSLIVNKEGNRRLTGDSIFYNRIKGFGNIYGNMFLQDTLQKVILKGHYGYYNDLAQTAMATDSAYCIEYSQGDSLYLHADTLKLKTDSIHKEVKAFYNVRFYRSDIQGVCDSMQYNSKDSTLFLYKDPIIWSDTQQLSGDTIEVLMSDSTIDLIHVKKYCFAIEQKDSLHFNQLKGRDLKAYFKNKDINYILVEGNAESIFYPEEKDGSMVGMNQSESSFLSIELNNKKFEKLKLWPKASGKMIPLPDLNPEQTKLKDFEWFDYLRPKDKDDIFRKVKKKTNNVTRKKSNKFQQE